MIILLRILVFIDGVWGPKILVLHVKTIYIRIFLIAINSIRIFFGTWKDLYNKWKFIPEWFMSTVCQFDINNYNLQIYRWIR